MTESREKRLALSPEPVASPRTDLVGTAGGAVPKNRNPEAPAARTLCQVRVDRDGPQSLLEAPPSPMQCSRTWSPFGSNGSAASCANSVTRAEYSRNGASQRAASSAEVPMQSRMRFGCAAVLCVDPPPVSRTSCLPVDTGGECAPKLFWTRLADALGSLRTHVAASPLAIASGTGGKERAGAIVECSTICSLYCRSLAQHHPDVQSALRRPPGAKTPEMASGDGARATTCTTLERTTPRRMASAPSSPHNSAAVSCWSVSSWAWRRFLVRPAGRRVNPRLAMQRVRAAARLADTTDRRKWHRQSWHQ